ncbi:MAG: hypothetical protein LBQ62_02960, partial [Candidatus Accumulibacter sp.]|nr:hypothetical protein [Accumulibacter sp.]
LGSLLAVPPDYRAYFQLLEHMRPSVILVAEELSRRYVNKPLPLGDAEDAFFHEVVLLWLKTAKAYAHCAESIPPGSSRAEDLAVLLHRRIHFTGMAILEHHRVRREMPWGLWHDLHGHYKSAEEMRLATLEIPDIFEERADKTHCAAVYLAFILCDMAGSYGLSWRAQKLVRRWASAWSPLIGLHPVTVGEALPSFVIDLTQDIALRPSSECLHTAPIRRLDTARLADRVSRVRQQLRQRIPPSEIGLGDDCTPQQCTQLLGHLARQWSQARAARKFRRHATSGTVQVCTSFEEMYYFVSGHEFQPPEDTRGFGRGGFDEVFSLRFQDGPRQPRQEEPAASYDTDAWEMVDHSANGFRLIRNADGRKMAHGQLLALRPRDSERFLLAQVTWLMQENSGGLIAGLRALPGLPRAVGARPVGSPGGPKKKYQRAFLMPALNTGDSEQSLVLPAGWIRPGLLIEISDDGVWRAKLKKVLDSGPDFERVSLESPS